MYVEVLGKKINYECKGNGDPIILVHGWGGNLHSMGPLSDLLSKKYKCFLLDLPGFGKSQNPDSDWGIEEYALFIESFVKKVVNAKVIYCGHSFGGALGLQLAKNTDVVEKMILMAPSFKRDNQDRTSFSKSSFYNRCKGCKKVLYPFKKLYYKIFYPHSQLFSYPHLEDNFRKIVKQDLTSILGEIDIPTLILWGEQDSFVSIDDAYLLDSRLQNSRLKTYTNVEHNLPFAKATEVADEIFYFLEK